MAIRSNPDVALKNDAVPCFYAVVKVAKIANGNIVANDNPFFYAGMMTDFAIYPMLEIIGYHIIFSYFYFITPAGGWEV